MQTFEFCLLAEPSIGFAAWGTRHVSQGCSAGHVYQRLSRIQDFEILQSCGAPRLRREKINEVEDLSVVSGSPQYWQLAIPLIHRKPTEQALGIRISTFAWFNVSTLDLKSGGLEKQSGNYQNPAKRKHTLQGLTMPVSAYSSGCDGLREPQTAKMVANWVEQYRSSISALLRLRRCSFSGNL